MEPPLGFKSNIQQIYQTIDPEEYDTWKPTFKQLFYKLAYFHTLIT